MSRSPRRASPPTSKGGNCKALLDAVPRELRSDPGYIFAQDPAAAPRREDRRSRAADDDRAEGSGAAHNLDEWWIERRLLARKLLDNGEFRTAYLIARDAALPAKDNYKTEQEFTAGWIALRFLNDPATADAAFRPHRRRQRQSDRAGARRLLAGPRRGSRRPCAGGARRLHPRRRAIDQLLRPARARQARPAADRAERRARRRGRSRRAARDRARRRSCSTRSTSASSRSRCSPTWARTAIPRRWSGSAS